METISPSMLQTDGSFQHAFGISHTYSMASCQSFTPALVRDVIMQVDHWGGGGVAGERRVVAVPKFYSWGKCTMPLMNINSDWMSNASSGLCINSLYTEFHFLQVLLRLLIPCMSRIFTSAMS